MCVPQVPPLFTENFDYEHLRTDFVRGVLTSDLLSKSIYCHIVQSGYVARVKDPKAYATVRSVRPYAPLRYKTNALGSQSKDILSRRVFPLVPDDNHLSGANYEFRREQVYIAKEGVMLSR
jgi:translation initiation factor eIF-2B subunit epsilon